MMKSCALASSAAGSCPPDPRPAGRRRCFPDRSAEQQRVLQHEADLIPQRLQRELADVGPSILTAPAIGSKKRGTRLAIVLLPMPDGPTIAATWPGSTAEAHVFQDAHVLVVAKRDVVEFDVPLERRRLARAGQVADRAFGAKDFLDPFVADGGLRERVGHLRQVFDRLVGLLQIHQEDDQHARAQLTGWTSVHAVGEDQARAERDDDVDHRRQLGFDAARLQAGVDVVAALGVEPPIFVVLARKRLDDLDRREDFRDAGQQLALLSS